MEGGSESPNSKLNSLGSKPVRQSQPPRLWAHPLLFTSITKDLLGPEAKMSAKTHLRTVPEASLLRVGGDWGWDERILPLALCIKWLLGPQPEVVLLSAPSCVLLCACGAAGRSQKEVTRSAVGQCGLATKLFICILQLFPHYHFQPYEGFQSTWQSQRSPPPHFFCRAG